jgi:hypothetical protein
MRERNTTLALPNAFKINPNTIVTCKAGQSTR